MMSLLQLDRSVFTWINTGWSNPVLDFIMPLITRLGDSYFTWLWIAFISLIEGWQQVRRSKGTMKPYALIRVMTFFCLYLALIYGINSGVYNGLKEFFHRSRPYVQQSVILRPSPAIASVLSSNRSFPSGHACNAFMIAVILAERFRRKRYAFYGLAAMVAFSRVYLGVHYPGDVMAGACLGFAITWFMLYPEPVRKRMNM